MSRFISPRLAGLKAYVPGEQPQGREYIKLNTNESPYPPSPKVAEWIDREQIEKLKLYCDPDGRQLRAKLALTYGVGIENVMLGNGSDEILALAFMGFCDSYTGVAYPDISYGFYSVYADLYGIDALAVPLAQDFSVRAADYFGLNRTIVIANPNAPTGINLPAREIERILQQNRNSVVIIDEAYVDFGGETCLPLVQKYDNLIVVRTYSKSRSLAGARLGFAIAGAELIRDLETLRCSTNPYNVNRLTLLAGEASLCDNDYFEWCRAEIIRTREMTAEGLRALGFEMTDSRANFLFAKHPRAGGQRLLSALRERGILVRRFEKERIADHLRITIGSPDEMDALIRALGEILEEEKLHANG